MVQGPQCLLNVTNKLLRKEAFVNFSTHTYVVVEEKAAFRV